MGERDWDAAVPEIRVVRDLCTFVDGSALKPDYPVVIEASGLARLDLVNAEGEKLLRVMESAVRETDGVERLRRWVGKFRGGILRPHAKTPMGWHQPDQQLQRFNFGKATAYCMSVERSALLEMLGPAHYEEYDSLRTTGEPWFYWAFEGYDSMACMVESAEAQPYAQLYFNPGWPPEPSRWLKPLNLHVFDWVEMENEDRLWGHGQTGRFNVMRQDDNGQTFVMRTCTNDYEARRWVEVYEARGHKQDYWVESAD